MAETVKVQGLRRRHRRVRRKLSGTPERPRLAVFRSSRHIYAQVIDDSSGRTLAAASSLKDANGGHKTPKDAAKSVGLAVAAKAKEAGITAVRFDRGGFTYHGRVQALADGAREGGLNF